VEKQLTVSPVQQKAFSPPQYDRPLLHLFPSMQHTCRTASKSEQNHGAYEE
jgi:hypothetical protein